MLTPSSRLRHSGKMTAHAPLFSRGSRLVLTKRHVGSGNEIEVVVEVNLVPRASFPLTSGRKTRALAFSDRWSRGTKLWERDCVEVRVCEWTLEGQNEASFPPNFKPSMDGNKFYYL